MNLALRSDWQSLLTGQVISSNLVETIAVCIAYEAFVVSNISLPRRGALKIAIISDSIFTVDEVNRCLSNFLSQRSESFSHSESGPHQSLVAIPAGNADELSTQLSAMRVSSRWPGDILSSTLPDRNVHLRPLFPRITEEAAAAATQFPETDALKKLRKSVAAENLFFIISWYLREQLIRHRVLMRAIHVPGEKNKVADLLSRIHLKPNELSDARQLFALDAFQADLTMSHSNRAPQIDAIDTKLQSCTVAPVSPLERGDSGSFIARVLLLASAATGVLERFVRIPIVSRHFPSDPLNMPILYAPLTSSFDSDVSGPSPYEQSNPRRRQLTE